MVGSSSHVEAGAVTSEPLDVRLSIRPPTGCDCPLLHHNTKTVRRSSDGRLSPGTDCRLVIHSGVDATFQTVKIGEQCLCPIFDAHDCVWGMTETDGEHLKFAVTLPDRTEMSSLMRDLEETNASVTLERVMTASGNPDTDEMLTEKQREAFLAAVEGGYYESPRQTSLEEIAEELDITKSAVSERLSATRRRFAKKFAEQYDD